DHGGDTDGDGTNTPPKPYDWGWIEFADSSDDDANILRHCNVLYGGKDRWGSPAYDRYYGAITLFNAASTISNCIFSNNYRVIEARDSSTPNLTCNDVHDNTNYGIYNNVATIIVVAENHWWGSSSGPTHSGNPGGMGQSVSDGVDYEPWAMEKCVVP